VAQNLVMFGDERCARGRCSMEWESAGGEGVSI